MNKTGKNSTKVTWDDIRSIKAGTEVTYTVDHPKRIDSIKARAYMLNSREPELRKRYSCKSNFANRTVTIKAEAV